jgi:hypothetical protein
MRALVAPRSMTSECGSDGLEAGARGVGRRIRSKVTARRGWRRGAVRMLAFCSATDDVCALVFGAAEGFVPNDRCLQRVRVKAVPRCTAGANVDVPPIDRGGVDKGVGELPTMDVW